MASSNLFSISTAYNNQEGEQPTLCALSDFKKCLFQVQTPQRMKFQNLYEKYREEADRSRKMVDRMFDEKMQEKDWLDQKAEEEADFGSKNSYLNNKYGIKSLLIPRYEER